MVETREEEDVRCTSSRKETERKRENQVDRLVKERHDGTKWKKEVQSYSGDVK